MKLATVLLPSVLLLAPSPVQERALGVRRTVYVLEVDLERARSLGWAAEDAKDEAVLAGAVRVVKKRLDAMERESSIETDAEHHRIELAMPQVQPRDRELFGQMLQSIGLCEFGFGLADDERATGIDVDMGQELFKFMGWREANPDAPLATFDLLDDDEHAPHPRVWWVETDSDSDMPFPMLLPDVPEDCFGAGSFAKTEKFPDAEGTPALLFELKEDRAEDFARVTGANIGERLAIVIEGKLRAAPTLDVKLEGGGEIDGTFDEEEIDRLVEAFTELEGPLQLVETR